MFGAQFQWLISVLRSPRALRARLAHTGLLTLAIGVLGAACLLVGPAQRETLARVAVVPVTPAAPADDASAWPHVIGRIWIILPSLVPAHR